MVRPGLSKRTDAPYSITIRITIDSIQSRDTILAALQPEFASIDSKRLKLHNTSSQNDIVFHFAAKDVTALRAATTSLLRLYLVADGVRQFTVKNNG
jgi:tRNA threonylcarbamoyladenosine modification (KEOPS) complex  Pcc1 subunit